MKPSHAFKVEVIKAFVSHFESEIQVLEKSVQAAHEAATHEESKAEDQHDTRAIEASYLVAGQTQRIADIKKTIHEFKAYLDIAHQAVSEIRPGVLVSLRFQNKSMLTFFAGQGGGTSIEVDSKRVTVTTPLSPLGQALLDCKPGDEALVEGKNGEQVYSVDSYC